MIVMALSAIIIVFFLFGWVLYIRPVLFSAIGKGSCCAKQNVKPKRKPKKLPQVQEPE